MKVWIVLKPINQVVKNQDYSVISVFLTQSSAETYASEWEERHNWKPIVEPWKVNMP